MPSDVDWMLDQLDKATSTAKNMLEDVLNVGGGVADQAAVMARDGVEKMNELLGISIPLPSLPKSTSPPARSNANLIDQISGWIYKHQAFSAAAFSFLATGAIGVLLFTSRELSKRKPRRAKRSKNGSRREVIVIIGKPGSAPVRGLMADLERRGFIVYVVVRTGEDVALVQSECRSDIRPLVIDIDNEAEAIEEIEQFNRMLNARYQPFPGDSGHTLSLTGIILMADHVWMTDRAERRTESFRRELTSQVVEPMTTLNMVLALAIENQTRIAIVTPSIVSALTPPLHISESTAMGAFEKYASTLARELKPKGVWVSHIKLGNIGLGSALSKSMIQHREAEMGQASSGELNRAVFDVLTMKRPIRMVRVGQGSMLYDQIGYWAPFSLIGMFIRRQQTYR